MKKHTISIVIPSIKSMESCPIFKSFTDSAVRDRLYVQFVFLHNPIVAENLPSHVQTHDGYETLFIGNKYFLLTSEENIFRLQDFLDLLKPHLFVVGEHDEIEWEALVAALDYCATHQLDAMCWNVNSKQDYSSGWTSSIKFINDINDPRPANQYIREMTKGKVLDSRIGFAAFLSFYGPIYALSFIGSHLFSRATFARMMQYKFPEPFYAHVYMQAALFSEQSLRYGYFNTPVLTRTGSEMEKLHKGTYSFAATREARMVQGHTAAYQICHLANLNQLEDDVLFHMLVTSIGVAYKYVEGGGQTLLRQYMLYEMLNWSHDVLRQCIRGKSYYFPELARKSSMQDLRYIKQVFMRVLNGTVSHPQIYAAMSQDFKRTLLEGILQLGHYLQSLTADVNSLQQAADGIEKSLSFISLQTLMELNEASFNYYLQSKKLGEIEAAPRSMAHSN